MVVTLLANPNYHLDEAESAHPRVAARDRPAAGGVQ